MSKLVARTVPSNLLFVGEILGGGKDFKPKMDELVRMNTTKANAALTDIDDFQTSRFAFYLAPSHLEHTLVFLRLSEDPLFFFFIIIIIILIFFTIITIFIWILFRSIKSLQRS